ncbi:Pentatricopeptide repeat-containing protein, mitochondrial [Heracleum sosnowskyi]|uniref:Pentatricopeptide repeat-containing protein, mitochondrial n=1 Tax=Heracleum sosnowskyi TaxID=360622 RepID=A0AAD8N1W7_9APIA|nr:Pentatricopeptide repeat-containing protein, mitochondrial [Heracleum sosnowskyi]
MSMIKTILNRSRGFSSSIRYLCTAVKKEYSIPASTKSDVLYNRLSLLGKTGGSAIDTLNQYFSEGNYATKYQLDTCIWQLRKFGKANHALQVMEWMKTRNIKFHPTDHAKFLDLLSKVKGISAAENYFSGLPESAKEKSTYGALLNCYCREILPDKAQTLFEEMDKLCIVSSLTFNNLMSLYMRRRMPEAVIPLVQEMKNRNIPLTIHTYNIWMTSYSQMNDIEGVETVFEEIKVKHGEEQCNWTTFSNLAVAYVKAGHKEKAESALKNLEAETRKMGRRCDREPFHYLISLYAGTSNLVEVYRIWKHLKSSFRVTTNISTLIMVQSLARLDDIDGFKKIFQEWESTCSSYDLRIAKTAILLYVKHGLIREAEDVFQNILKRCKGPVYQHGKPLILYYLNEKQVDLALRCLEAATSEVKDNEWPQIYEDVNGFVMEYFKKERDVNGAEKCYRILKRVRPLGSEAYKLLLEIYLAAGKKAPEMRRRIMDDGIEISSELEELLGSVCPE